MSRQNIAVIGVTRSLLLGALENGVSKWPKKDGRFPQVSGLAFRWDSRKVRKNGASHKDLGSSPLRRNGSAGTCER